MVDTRVCGLENQQGSKQTDAIKFNLSRLSVITIIISVLFVNPVSSVPRNLQFC